MVTRSTTPTYADTSMMMKKSVTLLLLLVVLTTMSTTADPKLPEEELMSAEEKLQWQDYLDAYVKRRYDLGRRDMYERLAAAEEESGSAVKRRYNIRGSAGLLRSDMGKRAAEMRSDVGKRYSRLRSDMGKRSDAMRRLEDWEEVPRRGFE